MTLSCWGPLFRSLRSAWTHKIQMRVLFAVLSCFSATYSVRAQTPEGSQQPGPKLQTWGELQHQIDALESDKDTVNFFLKKEAFDIFDSSFQGLNSGIDASVGAFFLRTAEFEKIQKTISEAEAAAKGADVARQEAQAALKSGQHDLAIAKTLDAARLGAEATAKFKDAFDQTADVLERAGGVVIGETKPQELAKRFWSGRHDVAKAFKELSLAGQAMENHELGIFLFRDLNKKISELRVQQKSAPYALPPRLTPQVPENSTKHPIPVGSPSFPLDTKNSTSLPGTHPIVPQNGKVSPQTSGAYPNTAWVPGQGGGTPEPTGPTAQSGQAPPFPTGLSSSLSQNGQNSTVKGAIQAIDSALQNPQITLAPLPENPQTQSPQDSVSSQATGFSDHGTGSGSITSLRQGGVDASTDRGNPLDKALNLMTDAEHGPNSPFSKDRQIHAVDDGVNNRVDFMEISRGDGNAVTGQPGSSSPPPFGYPISTRQSGDGRLTAVTQLSFQDAGGVFPRSIMRWAVYDNGKYVGVYDSDVNLLENGKYQVLTSPGAMGIMTPDGKFRAPVYTTYDAGLEIQNQQFAQANSNSLRNSGYRETQAFGGGVYAGTNGISGWDLLDSQGNKLGEGGYRQTKALGNGVIAATKDVGSGSSGWDVYNPAGQKIASGYHQIKPLVDGTFAGSREYLGGAWEVLDPNGHRLGDGSYADVAVQNGQIAAWKQMGGGSPSYLPHPTANLASSLIQQPSASLPATGGIYLGGQQKYTTKKGLEADSEEELSNAEVVPKKKKDQ